MGQTFQHGMFVKNADNRNKVARENTSECSLVCVPFYAHISEKSAVSKDRSLKAFTELFHAS